MGTPCAPLGVSLIRTPGSQASELSAVVGSDELKHFEVSAVTAMRYVTAIFVGDKSLSSHLKENLISPELSENTDRISFPPSKHTSSLNSHRLRGKLRTLAFQEL